MLVYRLFIIKCHHVGIPQTIKRKLKEYQVFDEIHLEHVDMWILHNTRTFHILFKPQIFILYLAWCYWVVELYSVIVEFID